MGKQRVTQLLDQLKANQRQELHNAAAIYTVAQVAVNQLAQVAEADASAAIAPPAPALAPAVVDRATLLQRYGSYNNCRRAAKQRGITFSRSPSWDQLVAAFRYAEALQILADQYMQTHPQPSLKGVAIAIRLP